jgi:hypothetical protein
MFRVIRNGGPFVKRSRGACLAGETMGIGSTLEAARIGAREPSSYMGAGHLCDLAWYIRKYESGVINWGRWREEGGEFLLAQSKASSIDQLEEGRLCDELESWPGLDRWTLSWNVRKVSAYIRSHTRFLLDYGATHRRGLPISSGIAESAVNQVVRSAWRSSSKCAGRTRVLTR